MHDQIANFPKQREAFEAMDHDEAIAALVWITQDMTIATFVNCSSEGIRERFMNDLDVYMAYDAFKGAMLAVGYTPENPDDRDWIFIWPASVDDSPSKMGDRG